MKYTTFQTTQYVLGRGSLEKLKEYKGSRIGLVIDEGIIGALSLEDRLYQDILQDIEYRVLCNVTGEPDMDMLEDAIVKVKEYAPDYIVAIGGGSVMDAAKALWLFYELPDYDWDKAMRPYEVEPFPGKADLVAVPTTSGTGSETTGCAVIKDHEKRKCMILSNEIIPKTAILDFDLLKSLPPSNIAFSGTDALAHALESAVSQPASAMVKLHCIQAAVTLINNLEKSVQGDEEARELVHIAASMAGAGINNSITGMAHGMDQAGGDFCKPHGMMTGLLLPYTMRYLSPQPIYEEVAKQLGYTGTSEEMQNKLITSIWQLYQRIGMPVRLQDVGIPEEEYIAKIPSYVERAMQDANILCAPKNPNAEELKKLYLEFYYGENES